MLFNLRGLSGHWLNFRRCPVDKSLAESDLCKKDITVLAIVHGDSTIPNPGANTKIRIGDELISFGDLEKIKKGVGASDK